MPLTLDVLLAILVATLIANTLVMVLLVRRARNRSRALTAAGRTEPTGASLASTGGAVPGSIVRPALDPRGAPPRPEPAGSDTPGFLDAGAYHALLAREEGRLQRYHRPVTVAVFELEGLARLSERLGNEAGDRVVAAMADTVRRLAREADHVATLGTGRFAVLLPETDEVAAINYVERVRRASELWLESSAVAVRLAIGWAGTTGDATLLDTHQAALDRMYTEARRHARSAAAVAGVDVDVVPANGIEPAVAS